MKLFLCPVSQKSLYIQLMLRELQGEYEPVFREEGGLAEAIACLEAGETVLVHVQWEEFFFLGAQTAPDADAAAERVKEQLRRVTALGGKIVWTVHNALPHQIVHVDQFLEVRRLLARLSTRILVHNHFSRDFLGGQVDLSDNEERIRVLPHPSYAGLYEPEDDAETAVRAGAARASGKFLLGFGTIRKQKGFDMMLETLDPDFNARLAMRVRIAGPGPEGHALQSMFGHRGDIDWDLNYVPMSDVPQLFRAASGIMLPYTRLLTSGVALLALTLGGIIIAPALPTFVDLLPAPLRRFLYDPETPGDLRRVVTELANLTPEEDHDYRLSGMEAVRAVHPRLISAQLGAIYRDAESKSGKLPSTPATRPAQQDCGLA